MRDLEKFKELGINTVRVYTVDNSANHDECMNALAEAGIYLALDVNTPDYSINRDDPEPSYNDVYLQSVFATIDIFAQYDNTLLFFSGNEIINDGPTSVTAPWIKAVTRDVRQYIRSRDYRSIPVGYSAADVDENRREIAQFMNCGSDDERSDFFAFNDYSWCDPSSFEKSGWDQKVETWSDYGIPLFLSEFGCIEADRKFGEVAALYSDKMSSVYSGGIAYEYTEEDNKYGLVEINGDEVEEKPDFKYLKEAFEGVADFSGDGDYSPESSKSECPAQKAPEWDVEGTALPAIPEPAKDYMKEGAGDGPGLEGSSQNAGTPSEGDAEQGSGASDEGDGDSEGGSGSDSGAGTLVVPAWSASPVVWMSMVVVSSLTGACLL